MSAALSLPTRAQLLELRRAGVTEYRRTTGDETVLLTLRPLYGGRPADERRSSEHCSPKWSDVNDRGKEWARLSRGQRRRRNRHFDKACESGAITIQRVARGRLARLAVLRTRSSTTHIQSTIRRFLATKKVAGMKQPAENVMALTPWVEVATRKRRATPPARSPPVGPPAAPAKRPALMQPSANLSVKSTTSGAARRLARKGCAGPLLIEKHAGGAVQVIDECSRKRRAPFRSPPEHISPSLRAQWSINLERFLLSHP
jgi:hypothetical protein